MKNTAKQTNKIEAVPIHSYGPLSEVQILFLMLEISPHLYHQDKIGSQMAQPVKVLVVKSGGRVQLIPRTFTVIGENGCLYVVL